MKKLVFTAFAVVAFSWVAMAENSESVEVLNRKSDCMTNAMNTVDCFQGSDVEAYDLYQYLISKC